MKGKRAVVILFFVLFALGILVYLTLTRGWLQTIGRSRGVEGVHNQGTATEVSKEAAVTETQQENPQPLVEIPLDRQQQIGMKTEEVSLRSFRRKIRAVGRIDYDERLLATVNTKFEGWIEKLHIDYTGRYVRKGEPLVEIYSPELFAAQQEFLQLLRWQREREKDSLGGMVSRDAGNLVQAARQRLRLWDISEDQIHRIEQTGEPVRTLTLYSTVSGYVLQKNALLGMRVMAGDRLFDIADLSRVWVIADVYEGDLPLIREGQNARISLGSLPGHSFSARLDFVYPSLTAQTRTARVRFSIDNPGAVLKPQMFTQLEWTVDAGRRLSIPDQAVIDTGERQIVYVSRGDGNFEPKEVILGIAGEGIREVKEGLKAGERVAASATFLIDSEAQLRGVRPVHK